MHALVTCLLPLLWLLQGVLEASAGRTPRMHLQMSSDRKTADLPPGLLRRFEELCRVSVLLILPQL